MANLADLITELAPEVTVSRPLAIRTLRRVARKFFQDALVWKLNLSVAGDGNEEVPLIFPAATVLAKPVRVYVDDCRLEAASRTLLQDTTLAKPSFYLEENGVVLVVSPAPASTTVKVEVAVKPSFTATTLPDLQIDLWGEAIIYGTLGTLLTNKEDSANYNPDRAAGYNSLYAQELGRAQRKATNDDLAKHSLTAYGGL